MQGGLTDGLKSRLIGELQAAETPDAVLAEARAACDRLGSSRPTTKTRFYNLCLHDTAENGEKNPGALDLVQRGSLLTWIDVLYQKPESENDRTLGRWVNALLATDSFPADVVNRIIIKEFGVGRPLAPQLERLREYAYRPDATEKYVQEPVHHGDFARFEPGADKEATDIAYWRQIYRMSESEPVLAAPTRTMMGKAAGKKVPREERLLPPLPPRRRQNRPRPATHIPVSKKRGGAHRA